MSQIYSRSIRLSGEAGALFDHVRTFLVASDFKVVSEERPFVIVADRGSRWPTNHVQRSNHTISVAVHPANEGVTMSFTYIMGDFWNHTPGDRHFFDNEIDQFTKELVIAGVKLEKPMGPAYPGDMAYIGELRGLAKLKAEGLITSEEFELKKRKLLGI